MICKTTAEFQSKILKNLGFEAFSTDTYTLYKSPNDPTLGYFIKFSRDGYYDFLVGDYTIPKDFSLSFDHKEELIRFGTLYSGESIFKIDNKPLSSFSPSSFFIWEKGLRGSQAWKKGQHFHGAEIIIYKKYFDEVLIPTFKNTITIDNFINNYTYKYLPVEIVSIIQRLRGLADSFNLTPIYLESKILESIALLHNEILSSKDNVFTRQLDYGEITIGKNRRISLTLSDITAIEKAHEILTKEVCNPPTIKSLSKTVFLNEQKLKAGFLYKYHMTINQYSNSIRMALAENLLSTTDLSIDEISKSIGYNHTGNFIKMFKKVHGKTPLSFRKMK